MKKAIYLEDKIVIHAPISRVWSVLTESDETVKYMYGCELECDWEIGSLVLWRGRADQVVYVKGNLLKLNKNQEFTYTVFDPNAAYADVPENHLTVKCELSDQEGKTELKVTQGNFATVAEGESRYNDVAQSGGWEPLLQTIKTISEENH